MGQEASQLYKITFKLTQLWASWNLTQLGDSSSLLRCWRGSNFQSFRLGKRGRMKAAVEPWVAIEFSCLFPEVFIK